MFRELAAASVLFALLSGPILAQTPASVTYYGTACAGSNQVTPKIRVHPNYPPRIGGTMATVYYGDNAGPNLSAAWPALITGLRPVSMPLPRRFPVLGGHMEDRWDYQPPGCTLYVTPDLIMFQPWDPTGIDRYIPYVMLSIPNDRSLIGFKFYQQWAVVHRRVLDPALGTFYVQSVTFSERAEITVGV